MNKFKVMLPSLVLLAVFFLASSSALAADYVFNLPAGVKIGEISGPGSEQLSRALKKRTRKGSTEMILSGQVSVSRESGRERESVPLEKQAGEVYEDYVPDEFTGRVWLTEVTPLTTTLDNFDLERHLGLMALDWKLTAAGGGVVEEGRVVLNINRTRGGYLATQGVVPPLSSKSVSEDKNFERRLADDLVRLLALDLGRAASASEIEVGNDAWSRKAKKLASAGDWEGAKKQWLELLELNSEYAPALYNLGLYWEREGKPQEALRYYRSAFVSEASVLHRTTLTRLTETMLRAGRMPGRGGKVVNGD